MRNVSDELCTENQNTYLIFNNFFPRKSCLLWDNVKKYCTAGQATDDNMVHAHWMLDTEGYKHTLIICNTYSFSTASLVVRTRLNITLNVHYLSGFAQVHTYYRWKHTYYILKLCLSPAMKLDDYKILYYILHIY